MVVADGGSARDAGFAGFLRARARGATDSRLALDIGVGSVAMIVASALRPERWALLASAGLVLLSFGLWAVADRLVEDRAHPAAVTIVLRAARALVGAVGVAAAVGTGFILWTMAMGTWIS